MRVYISEGAMTIQATNIVYYNTSRKGNDWLQLNVEQESKRDEILALCRKIAEASYLLSEKVGS